MMAGPRITTNSTGRCLLVGRPPTTRASVRWAAGVCSFCAGLAALTNARRPVAVTTRSAVVTSSDPVPPYFKYLLGGWSSLRGYKAGQYFGDTVVTGTAELRIPLTSALSVGKIGVSAFVDTGAAYDKGQRFDDATLRTGIGGSVWMSIASFQMNLSVAHGRGDKTRVNFGGGFMF